MLTNGYLIVPQSLIILWLAVILIYRHFYNRNINRILDGEKRHPMMPPWKLSLITLVAVLLVYNVISTVRIRNTKRQAVYDSSQFFAMSYSGDSWEKLDAGAYNGMYSHEENRFYSKTEYTQNDFAYTVFTSGLPHDGMHPDLLVYIEYLGDPDDYYTMFSACSFLDPDGNIINTSIKQDSPASHFMYMLRYDKECTAEITLAYMENEEDAAAAAAAKLDQMDDLFKETAKLYEKFTLTLKNPY